MLPVQAYLQYVDHCLSPSCPASMASARSSKVRITRCAPRERKRRFSGRFQKVLRQAKAEDVRLRRKSLVSDGPRGQRSRSGQSVTKNESTPSDES
jgi:hypothetical protein